MEKKVTILLVEDDKIDQRAFKRSLGKNSFEYVIAESLQEASALLKTRNFEVIVTDYQLGDGTAFDVMACAGEVPVIVVTGAGDEEIAVRALKSGARDYLIKDMQRNYLKILPVTVENAIRHRRLEVAEREQRTLAEALRDSATILTSTLDLEEVLERILVNARRVVPYDAAEVMLVEGACAHIVQTTLDSHSDDAESLYPHVLEIDAVPNLHRMYETRQAVLINDMSMYHDWIEFTGAQKPLSYVGAPLCMGNNVVGFLNLSSNTPGFFTPTHAERLQAFADQAAVAIENAQLYKKAQELAAIEERQRLARELHDSVTQTLFTASIVSGSLLQIYDQEPATVRDGLSEIHKLTRGALAEMRTLLLELRPRALTESALSDLLQQLVDSTAGRSTTAIHYTVDGKGKLPPDVQVAFYRIAQEALNNIVNHAQADEAWIYLQHNGALAHLSVRDNGRGFDVNNIPPDHFGVRIMCERAQAVDAVLTLRSQERRGTEIILQWAGKAE